MNYNLNYFSIKICMLIIIIIRKHFQIFLKFKTTENFGNIYIYISTRLTIISILLIFGGEIYQVSDLSVILTKNKHAQNQWTEA